jgi:predicted nucleic acid-binding Zn ribbon protein
MSGSAFTSIGKALAEYIEANGMEERLAEAAIVPDWAERVGPAIAAVTRPVHVTRGTLLVGVRSSAWLLELHMMERQIVRMLNTGREKGRLVRLRFVMDGGAGRRS